MTIGLATAKLSKQLAAVELLTRDEVAALFRTTIVTVINWVKNRDMPAIELKATSNSSWRFIKDDVLAWAKAEGIKVYDKPARKRPRVKLNSPVN